MLLVPKKQNKVTEERGNTLKAFGFCFFFLLQIKNEMFMRNEGNLVECSALDNCNTNRMEAV